MIAIRKDLQIGRQNTKLMFFAPVPADASQYSLSWIFVEILETAEVWPSSPRCRRVEAPARR